MAKDLGPAVKFPPPALFVGGLGVGVLLDRFGRVPSPIPDSGALQAIGVTLGLMGLALVYTGIITFRKCRTAIYPNRPAKLVVDHGVYAHTRNPMYVGMTVFYLGGVLVLHSLGALALLPIVLVVLHSQVIVREERHLHERFPAEYAEYCARVRRWL
jgi:protein-S-isoprenylcysteine O-methyltransferase Ste14